MINTVEIAGTLTEDPDCRDLKSGALLVEFTVAVKGVHWDRESRCDVIESTFIRCQAWEDVAELVAPLTKGVVVHVRGQLTQHEVTGRDGKTDRKTRVRALVVNVIRTPTGAGY